jgi:hypothetical protein
VTKILILGTYPIEKPSHGGQKRAAAIADKYKSLGAEVMYVGVYVKNNYRFWGKNDVMIDSPESLSKIEKGNIELIGDVATGNICVDDKNIYDQLTAKIKIFKPDIIQLEQVYLLPFIDKARTDGHLTNQELVYSSHNIEYPMKQEMLETAASSIPATRRKEIVDIIKGMERQAAKEAAIVIAVTQDDARELKKMGAKRVVIAPNGINKPVVEPGAITKLQNFYKKNGIEKTVLFVASGHPPNWTGFIEMVTTGLGYIPRNTRIIVIGGIGNIVNDHFKQRSVVDNVCFYRRAEIFGLISESKLGAALHLADVVILPIMAGGGSNLKTAEAIASGHQVVATQHAMRGYERLNQLPGIATAQTSEQFRSEMINALKAGRPQRNTKQAELAESVYWDKILGELKEVVSL